MLTPDDIRVYIIELQNGDKTHHTIYEIDLDTIVVVSLTSYDTSGYVNISYRTKNYHNQKSGSIALSNFIKQIRDYKIKQIIE